MARCHTCRLADKDSDLMRPQLSIAMFRSYTARFDQNFLNKFFQALPTVMIADQMYLSGNLVRFHTIT